MTRVITKNDMTEFFKNNAIDARALQDAAGGGTRSAQIQQAVQKADLNGDGVISGAREGAALFKNLDRYDRDGSVNTITLKGDAVDGVLRKAEVEADRPSSPGRPSRGLRSSGSETPLPSGDTLTPATARGSTLASDAQMLNRRYIGSGAVNVVQRNGGVAAFQFTGGMNVDTDGGQSKLAKSDRYYQSQTSMKWAGGKSLNADNIPFVVLPPSLAKATGAKLGDLVEVKKDGKSMFAIYGDVGPSMKLGEGSLALAKAFDKRAGPNNGIDNGVTYTVLPGSGARAGITNGGRQKTAEEIQQAGQAAFDQARAAGTVR